MQIIASHIQLIAIYNSTANISACICFFFKLKICMDNNLLHLLFPDFFQKTSNFPDPVWSSNKFPDFPEVQMLPLLVEIPRSKTKNHQGVMQKIFLDGGSPKKCDHQGIIQKKSVSGIQTLPLVIIDKKNPCYFTVFPGKTKPKVLFFKDSGRCSKILDYILIISAVISWGSA